MGKLLRKPNWRRHPKTTATALYHNRKNKRTSILDAYTEDSLHITVNFNGVVSGDLLTGFKFYINGNPSDFAAAVVGDNGKVLYTTELMVSGVSLQCIYPKAAVGILINGVPMQNQIFRVRNLL